MSKKHFKTIFTLMTVLIILVSSSLVLEMSSVKYGLKIEISNEISDFEGNNKTPDDTEKDLKQFNYTNRYLHYNLVLINKYFSFTTEIPLGPHIEKFNPPPKVI